MLACWVSRDGSRRLTVMVGKRRSWESDRTVDVDVTNTGRRIEKNHIWCFKGRVMPPPEGSETEPRLVFRAETFKRVTGNTKKT
jgi:hypothetical protein